MSVPDATDDEYAERALKLMRAGLIVGEAMLRSQVAISEVEMAVRRLNAAFGMDEIEVSITTNDIQLGLADPRLPWPISTMRVVDVGKARLDLLVRFQDLIARIEAGEEDLDATIRDLDEIATSDPPRPSWVRGSLYLLSVGAWVVFAGGGIFEVAAALVAALVVQAVVVPVAHLRLPEAFATATAAALAVAAPAAAAYVGLPMALGPAIVGGLYPLLPGALLVASVTDGLSGAPISAMAKGLQATFKAVALALGALGALVVVHDLDITNTGSAPHAPVLVLGLAAAVAATAIALSSSAPLRLAPTVMLLALAAWSVIHLLPPGSEGFPLGSFLGATVIGAGGGILGRIMHTSPSVYTTTTVFVLVPGFVMYLGMVAFAQGHADDGITLLIRALAISLAIAAGITLGAALTRVMPLPRARLHPWRRLSGHHD